MLPSDGAAPGAGEPPIFDDVGDDATNAVAQLRAGLACARALIEPKFLYDALGASLFEAITRLPEYPLARVEAALVAAHRAAIAAAMGARAAGGPRALQLVDLGAGDCAKARTWIEALRPRAYWAVDYSGAAMPAALEQLRADYPWLAVAGARNDFGRRLCLPAQACGAASVALYPGSSIGNFAPPQARAFLAQVRAACGAGLLLGVDLVKPAARLQLAYDDPLGVTAAFNRNVLRNVNRALGADFDVRDWAHEAHYDEAQRRVQMHLRALRDVEVRWPAGTRRFGRGERIHTEDSYKWDETDLRALLAAAGYGRQALWTDADWGFAVAWAAP